MKMILEFNEDEKEEFESLLKAKEDSVKYYSILFSIQQYIRLKLKYADHDNELIDKYLIEIRDMIPYME